MANYKLQKFNIVIGEFMKRKQSVFLHTALTFFLVSVLSASSVVAHVRKVDCDKGQKISSVLRRAHAGDTIRISGTCNERVVINKRVAIDGQGTATIDGGGGEPAQFSAVVTVNGARGVKIKGLTIQNGPGEGIQGLGGSHFTVEDTVVQDNGFVGISIAGLSRAELKDVTSQRNLQGLDIFNNSLVVMRGEVLITENLGFGTNVNANSTLEIRGANLQVTNNASFGMAIANGQLYVYSFDESNGSTITASNNFVGLGIGSSTVDIIGMTTITAENNVLAGLFCPNGGKFTAVRPSNFNFSNNRIGMFFDRSCAALIQGPVLTVENNDVGLLADAADTLHLVANPPNGSKIMNNGLDIDFKFGVRSTIDGIDVGTIACDSTVLSRGSVVCP